MQSVFLQEFTFLLRHQSSNLNKVVSVLNRRFQLLNTMHAQVMRFDTFQDLYSNNSFLRVDLCRIG